MNTSEYTEIVGRNQLDSTEVTITSLRDGGIAGRGRGRVGWGGDMVLNT